MQRIHPICHETLYPLIGRRVCAVTADGSRYYGTVGDVRDGRVLLTGCTIEEAAPTLSAAKRPGRARAAGTGGRIIKRPGKATTSAFYGGYGYGDYWFDFAALASLFLLAFLFI